MFIDWIIFFLTYELKDFTLNLKLLILNGVLYMKIKVL